MTCATACWDPATNRICIFWQGAIMNSKSWIKEAGLHIKHSSAQEMECTIVSLKANTMNGLRLRKHKTDEKK